MIVFYEFKRVFKKNYKSFLILIVIALMLLLSYNIVFHNSNNINNHLTNVSQKFLNIFNINKENFTSVNGYYAFYIKIMSFISSAFSITIGIEVARRDKIEQTRDFLYTKPIKRSFIIIYRILAALIFIFFFTFFIFISSLILFSVKNYNFDTLKLFQIDFSLFLLMSVFFSYGLVLGGFVYNKIHLISFISIIPFILINIIDQFTSFGLLYYLNPFSYFSFDKIISDGYQYQTLVITVFLQVFLINFGINIYERHLD